VVRSILTAMLLGTLLAACGGGGARSVLPGSGGSGSARSGGIVVPKSSNVALFNGELWYGAGAQLLGAPLQPGGTTAELDGSYDGIVDPVPVAMTVAPDATLYDLISDDETSWALQAYAPGTFGSARPEETIRGNGYPQQVILVGDGIDVLSTVNFNTSRASSTLFTYAYGAGNNPQPIRTLNLGANVTDVASDNFDHLFVAHRGGAGISVYPAAASCNCNPLRTIATGAKSNDAIAVSADGIAYVLSKDPGSGAVTIDAYAPGNDGPAPTRSIGPIPASHGTPMGGITVDSDGKVYVNFKDARNRNAVDVYAPNANGAAAPLQTIAMPTVGGYVTAIAIGPLVHAPPAPSGTLYVGNGQIVNAFPLSANGAVSPQRSLTALLGPDYLGGPVYYVAGSMATTNDGRLFVVRAEGLEPKIGGSCSIAAEDPNANGSTGWLYELPCDLHAGVMPARGAGPSLDIATFTASGVTITREFSSLGPISGGPNYTQFTTDPAGTMYFLDGTQLEVFPANATSLSSPIRTASFGQVGLLTAASDGTVYGVFISRNADATWSDTIAVIGPGQTSPSRSIGPFNESTDYITALAVDSADELFVALWNQSTGATKVNVYAPGASGMATPIRTLVNPVPPTSWHINAMTIFQ